jgi:hypothetical protein
MDRRFGAKDDSIMSVAWLAKLNPKDGGLVA